MQNSLSNGYLVLLRLQQGQVQHTFEKVRTPQHTGNYDLGIWKNLAITNISLHIKAVGGDRNYQGKVFDQGDQTDPGDLDECESVSNPCQVIVRQQSFLPTE